MNVIPTTVLSSPLQSLSVSPTHDLRLEVGRHRRCHHAHSMDA